MTVDRLDFGSRARVATLIKKLADAQGNKNGIADDESKPADQPQKGGVFQTNPLLYKLKAFFEVGLSKRDEETRLTDFVTQAKQQFGALTSIDKPAHVAQDDWNTFQADKAIAALRFDRSPSNISERMVHASGSVNGEKIDARELFTQRWPARTPEEGGTPRKDTTIVLAPGFLESGRNYYEQADLLNKQGYDIVIMDQQWAGMSTGKKGGIDRGFGIARDVAAVCADVAAHIPDKRSRSRARAWAAARAPRSRRCTRTTIACSWTGRRCPSTFRSSARTRTSRARARSSTTRCSVSAGSRARRTSICLRPVRRSSPGDQATLRKIAMHATTEELWVAGKRSARRTPTSPPRKSCSRTARSSRRARSTCCTPKIAIDTLVSVRDKVISAYEEIMKMPI